MQLTCTTGVNKQVLKKDGAEYFVLEPSSLLMPTSMSIVFRDTKYKINKIERGFGMSTNYLVDGSDNLVAKLIWKQGFVNQVEIMVDEKQEIIVDGNGIGNFIIRGSFGYLFRLFIPVTYKIKQGDKEIGSIQVRLGSRTITINDEAVAALAEPKLVALLVATALARY